MQQKKEQMTTKKILSFLSKNPDPPNLLSRRVISSDSLSLQGWWMSHVKWDVTDMKRRSSSKTRQVSQSASQPVSQSVSQSTSQPASQSVSGTVSTSVSQPASQPASQPVNTSVSGTVSTSVSQPIRQAGRQYTISRN